MCNNVFIMTSIEKLLKKLVSFQSITGDFSESKKLLNWVEKQINKSLIVKYFYSNKFPSLIATTRKTKTPKIFLVAHIDVVPAAKKMFHLKVKSDKFVARGVFDMKFALACYLQLIKDLKHNIKKFDFGLMLTADEEIGGFNGVKFLIDNGFNSKILFLPDGGENWSIQNVAKGVLHLTAEIQGKTAHGSRPWEGEEPFTELFAFLNELKKLFPVEPCGDIKHYHNSINIGKIIGGQAINQVASSVKTYIDIRHIPEVTKTKILKEIYKIKTKYSKVKIKEIAYGQSYKIDFKKT